jgi:putative Mn2+ efflux pump MntP
MPLLGFIIGARFGRYVAAWDHFIAFGLLTALGLKMLHEARNAGEDEIGHDDDALFSARTLVVLGIATSIDAFVVGVTLPMLNAPLVLSLVTIGVTTALLSALGLYLGRRFGAMLGKRLDAFGGLVLIALGTKILVEHLSQG